MKTGKKAIIAALFVIVIALGLRVWASYWPFQLGGPEWDSIEKCATNQSYLYQSLEYYVAEHGRIPDRLEEFKIRDFPATAVWECPATHKGYDLFLENYGNPKAVLIADKGNRHPTTLMYWLRGLNPNVQTMGDGTIHLFKGGKIMTMVGSKKK